MSDFHPETWNPMWSVSTILMGLYSFMLEDSPTHGSIITTHAQKRLYAKESLAFNVKNKYIHSFARALHNANLGYSENCFLSWLNFMRMNGPRLRYGLYFKMITNSVRFLTTLIQLKSTHLSMRS